MMAPFVSLGLAVCQKLEIADKRGQGMVLRFTKIYSPEKIARITQEAQQFTWWQKNPVAAFMKAVGVVNKAEKNG